MSKTLADLMGDYDAERKAEIARDEARRATPEEQARIAAKKAEEHERGVRLGWHDADGQPIPDPDEEPEQP